MAAGRKTGGRRKGSLNRKSREMQEKIQAEGITPLDYMLGLLRDETTPPDMRFEAAKAAAPYVHPRLNATDHSGEIATTVNGVDGPQESREAWVARKQREFLTMVTPAGAAE